MNKTLTGSDYNIFIEDESLPNLIPLKKELHQQLGLHPVPQSNPATKGVLFEIASGDLTSVSDSYPELATTIFPFVQTPQANYILAVNETPPGVYTDFAMRPHVDKRWSNGQFYDETPTWTQVMFLNFNSHARGGELLIFHPEQAALLHRLPRENARTNITSLEPIIIKPVAGRICKFDGVLPHAVLGYETSVDSDWRLSIVLAEF